MPVVYLGGVMNSGDVLWRPKFTSGLSDEGPDDQRLVIHFRGNLSAQPWVIMTSYGYAVDINALRVIAPTLFDKKWLQNRGLKKARISETQDHRYIIDIQL